MAWRDAAVGQKKKDGEGTEAPADVGQRKADLRACARWIVAALQEERAARRRLEEQLATQERLLDTRGQQLQARDGQLQARREQLHAMEERACSMEQQLHAMEERSCGMEQQLEAARRREEECSLQLEAAQAHAACLQEQLDASARAGAEQEQQQVELDEQVAALQGQVAELEARLAHADGEAVQQRQAVAGLRDLLLQAGDATDARQGGLRAQLEAAQLQAAAAYADVDRLEEEVRHERLLASQARQEAAALAARKLASDERVRALFEQREAAAGRLRAQVAALSAEVRRLRRSSATSAAAEGEAAAASPRLSSSTLPRLSSATLPAIVDALHSPRPQEEEEAAAMAVAWDACDGSDGRDARGAAAAAAALESFALRRRGAAFRMRGSAGERPLPPPLGPMLRAGGVARLLQEDAVLDAVLQGLADAPAAAEGAYPALVALLHAEAPARLLRLLQEHLSHDIARTVALGDPHTLFRGNSPATKLLSAATRVMAGPLLQETVGVVLAREQGLARAYELDPTRLPPAAVASLHAANLRELCQALLDAFLAAPLPHGIRCITAFLATAVADAFPQSQYLGIVNMLFLRFFCVAVAQPASFGLLGGERPAAPLQRGLVLASKALQNLANGATFKEAYMAPMNGWVQASGAALLGYFAAVSTPPQPQSPPPPPSAVELRRLRNGLGVALAPARAHVVAALRASTRGSSRTAEAVRLPSRLAVRALLDALLQQPMDEAAAHAFLALLCWEDAPLAAVCEALYGGAKGPPLEAAAASLATLFLHEGRAGTLLCFAADLEADLLGHLGHSSLLQAAARAVAATQRHCLRALVGDLVDSVVADRLHFEIDADRMAATTDQQLQRNVQSLLDLVAKAARALPPLIRKHLSGDLLQALHFAAAKKGQQVAPLLVAGILAPAITDPVAVGLLEDAMSSKVRRTLSLLGDVLAKLAKESLFYRKDPAYEAVDAFIMRNTTEFRAAVQQAVLAATPSGNEEQEVLLPWQSVEKHLRSLVEVLARKQDFLEVYIGESSAVVEFEWSYADLAETTLCD